MIINRQIGFIWRRIFVIMLVAGYFLFSGCNRKTPQKIYRVGILSSVDDLAIIVDGFKEKMVELGYIEGENIVYDLQKSNVDPVKEKQIAEKFVKDNVDLIFAFPTRASLAAKAATNGTKIPVVFAMADIEGTNLVASVRHPGGNITGVRDLGPDNVVKRLDILHEFLPQVKRIYIPYNPNYPNNSPALKFLRPAASSLGIVLIEIPVTSVRDIQADLNTRVKPGDIGIDAILLMQDSLVHSPDAGGGAITRFADEHKLPVVGVTMIPGASLSYGADLLEMGKLAAPLADKILRGIAAGTIPVVTPEARLRFNYKAIQKLGLKVNEGLLSRADEIIR